jgi:hypothetical protein
LLIKQEGFQPFVTNVNPAKGDFRLNHRSACILLESLQLPGVALNGVVDVWGSQPGNGLLYPQTFPR